MSSSNHWNFQGQTGFFSFRDGIMVGDVGVEVSSLMRGFGHFLPKLWLSGWMPTSQLQMSPLGEKKRSVDLDDGKRPAVGKSAGGISKQGGFGTQSANFLQWFVEVFISLRTHGSVENCESPRLRISYQFGCNLSLEPWLCRREGIHRNFQKQFFWDNVQVPLQSWKWKMYPSLHEYENNSLKGRFIKQWFPNNCWTSSTSWFPKYPTIHPPGN